LVTSLLALAQDTTKPREMKQETAKAEKVSTKVVNLSGKVGDDGKTLVDKDNKSWTVTNPEALKGHEGHEVTLKAHENAAKTEIQVVSVKMGKSEMQETKKEGRDEVLIFNPFSVRSRSPPRALNTPRPADKKITDTRQFRDNPGTGTA